MHQMGEAMSRPKFSIEIADDKGTRMHRTVASKSLPAALMRACEFTVKSGMSEHGVRAVIERRDA